MFKVYESDYAATYQNDAYRVIIAHGPNGEPNGYGYSVIRLRDSRALTVYKTKGEFATDKQKRATDATEFKAWGAPVEEVFKYLKSAHFRALLRWRGRDWYAE